MAWRILALACLLTSLAGCTTSTCDIRDEYHVGAILSVDAGYYQSCEADLSSGGKVARYAFGGPCDSTREVQPIGDSPVPSVSEASGCQVLMTFNRTEHPTPYLGSDSGTITITCDGRIVFRHDFLSDRAC